LSKKIQVLVVDDSAFSRQAIKNMLIDEPNIDGVTVAVNGIDAMSKVLRYKPGIITLDIEMPQMDGFTFLRWLMKERPTPVLMVSSRSDNKTVFRALDMGAVDFIAKPTRRASPELNTIKNDLLDKIGNINKTSVAKLNRNRRYLSTSHLDEIPSAYGISDVGVLAIGASTGGPQALQLIISSLPENFPLPIVISQHMPRGFTKPFSQRLNQLSAITVKEAEEGDSLDQAKVLICPGGRHMYLKKRGKQVIVRLKKASDRDKYVPSVDVMMRSVAEIFRNGAFGVILTGMGNDGKDGMQEIRKRGGYTLAESEKTAVVFGMPQEVIKAGAAMKVAPLNKIPAEILRIVIEQK
jgi:two-component system chemotaxis response regulator CheB